MRTRDLPRLLLGGKDSTIPAAAARAWCRSWWGGGVGLIVLCLAVYLPGLWSIPPVDRDESRFAQASRTMLESRDFIVPRLGNTPRLNKPPLIYWLQCASAAVFGDDPGPDGLGEWGNGNIWVFRLPSALCAIGTVLLTWRLGLRMFDPRAAALAAALLAVCPIVVWDAHQARADQLLLFTTTGAMFALYECWRRGVARTARPPVVCTLLFWVFIGLGILSKGPITPMIAALAAIALSLATSNWRWLLKLRPLLGLIICTAMVAPWVIAVAHRVGWETYLTTITDETLGRSIKEKESHWGPPGYHTVFLAVMFWPGSLMTAAAIVAAIRRTRKRLAWSWPRSGRCPLPWASAHGSEGARSQAPEGRQNSPVRKRTHPETFLLAWILPAWLIFELIATKLPHYTMPLYPAIALLTARAIFAHASALTTYPRSLGDRLGIGLWATIGIVGLVGSLATLAQVGDFRGLTDISPGSRVAIISLATLIMTIIGAAAISALRGRVFRAHALAVAAIILWCWCALQWVFPRCDGFWNSKRLAEIVGSDQWSPSVRESPIALVGYEEPSALFMFRGRASPVSPSDLDRWRASNPDGIVVVQTDVRKTPLAPPGLSVAADITTGLNYSTGKLVELHVFGLVPRPRSESIPERAP